MERHTRYVWKTLGATESVTDECYLSLYYVVSSPFIDATPLTLFRPIVPPNSTFNTITRFIISYPIDPIDTMPSPGFYTTADPEEIIRKNGVDPYVFYRFLQMMAKAMIPIWLLSWIILLPIDSVGSHVLGKEGLDRFTFGNVATDKQSRYWAHLILDYVFIGELVILVSASQRMGISSGKRVEDRRAYAGNQDLQCDT
jgi:hypothetical protein